MDIAGIPAVSAGLKNGLHNAAYFFAMILCILLSYRQKFFRMRGQNVSGCRNDRSPLPLLGQSSPRFAGTEQIDLAALQMFGNLHGCKLAKLHVLVRIHAAFRQPFAQQVMMHGKT